MAPIAHFTPGERQLRSVLLALVVSVFTLAQIAPAHAGDGCEGLSPSVPELCANTTVTFDGSAVVRVELRDPVSVDTAALRSSLLDIQAPGTVSGFALAAEDATTANAVLVGASAPASPEGRFLLGSDPGLGGNLYYGTPSINQHVAVVQLEPGYYRLSIFAVGPGTMTLHLPGLLGSSTFAATTPSGALFETQTTAMSPADSISSTRQLAARGVLLHFLAAKTTAFAASEILMCARMNQPTNDHACVQDGSKLLLTDRLPAPAPTWRAAIRSSGVLPADPYAVGYVHAVQGVVDQRIYTAVWLPIFV